MGLRSYFFRIMFLSWTGCICLVLAAALALGYLLTSEVEKDVEQSAGMVLDLAQWSLGTSAPVRDPEALQQWFVTFGELCGMRLTYTVNGKVLADSSVPADQVPAMENHANRPEISSAQESGRGESTRYSETLSRRMYYLARKVDTVPGLPDGVLRIASPVKKVAERVAAFRVWAAPLGLALLAGMGLVTYLLTRSAMRTLNEVSQVVAGIGRGDFEQRIRVLPGNEFAVLADSVNAMAKKLKKQFKALTLHANQLQAIFDGLSEGVAVINERGRLVAFNKAFLDIFGAAGERDPLGRPLLEVVMELTLYNAAKGFFLHTTQEAQQRLEITLPDKAMYSVTIVPFLDHKGRRRLILVFENITERRRLETMLSDFVANASHQLRTPLTSVRGYVETILETLPVEAEKSREMLQVVLRNAEYMSNLVSGMFALSKARSAPAKPQPVRVGEALTLAMRTMEFRFKEKAMHVDTTGFDTAVSVIADLDGLTQIFSNLFDNALKYCPVDSTVTVALTRDEKQACITVADEGPGIPEEESERIFDWFFRLDQHQGKSGGGLGLAICREIALSYGGGLDVSPGERGGSQFSLRLPLAPGEA